MDDVDKILAKHAPSVDDILARVGGGTKVTGELPQMSQAANEISSHSGDPGAPIQRGMDRVNDVAGQAAGAVNSGLDRWSLGLWGAAMRLAQKLNETGVGQSVNAQIAPDVNQGGGAAQAALTSMDEYRGRHPVLSNLTDAPAYAITGPTTAVAAGVSRLLPKVTSRGLTGAAANVSRNALASAGTSGVVAGSEAAARGESIGEAAPEIARATGAGLAIGAGAGVGGEAIGAAARKVLNSRGAQAREFITRRGGEVGPTTPGRKGPLEGSPDRPTDADIGEASQVADENVKGMMRQYQDRVAGQPYREAVGKVTPKMANMTLEISPIYKSLVKAANDPANLAQVGRLKELIGMIEQQRIPTAGGGSQIVATEEWMNSLRKGLGTISGVGETTSGRMAPLQRAFHEVKAVVDEGPYGPANAAYHKGITDVDESLKMVGAKRSSSPDEPISGSIRLKSQRAGQNSITAGADRLGVNRFREKHPDIALELDQPELLRSKADLGFRVLPPTHGGLLGATLGIPGAMIASQLMGHGAKGLAAIPLALAAQNATPIAGRLLYGPAQEAAIMAPLLGHRTDLLQAIRRAHEEGTR